MQELGNPIVPVPVPAPSVTNNITILPPTPDPELVKATGLELGVSLLDAAGEGLGALGRAGFEIGGIWTCDPLRGVFDVPQVAVLTTAMTGIALASMGVLVAWTAIRVTHDETTWSEAAPRLLGCALLAALARPLLQLGANLTVGLCHAVAGTDVTNAFGSGPTLPGLLSPAAGGLLFLLWAVALLLVALKAWTVLAVWALAVILAPLAAAAYAVPQLEGMAVRVGQLLLGSAVGLFAMVTVLTVGQPIFGHWGEAAPLGQLALRLALLLLAWKAPDLLMHQAGGGGINMLLLLRLLRR